MNTESSLQTSITSNFYWRSFDEIKEGFSTTSLSSSAVCSEEYAIDSNAIDGRQLCVSQSDANSTDIDESDSIESQSLYEREDSDPSSSEYIESQNEEYGDTSTDTTHESFSVSNDEDSGSSTHDSSSESEHYQNTKFLATEWRLCGQAETVYRGYREKIATRKRCSKFAFYRLMNKIHKHSYLSAEKIKERYWNKRTKGLYFLRGCPRQTINRWRREYSPDSSKWAQLCEFIENNSIKKAKNVKTFKHDPLIKHCGYLPVFESYILQLRLLKAKANEFRSVKWMMNCAKCALNNDIILGILKLRMDERELRAIREFQECGFSRGWIKRIMVFMLCIC